MDAESKNIQQEDFDRWLDAALHARADAEPRMGLEDRVLARLAADPPRKFVWWPASALAVAAAGLVITIAIVLLHTRQPEQAIADHKVQQANPVAVNSASVQSNSAPNTMAVHSRRRSRLINRGDSACCISTKVMAGRESGQERLPKLATFPAPRPLTVEERMLAELAAQLTVRQQFSEIANVSIDSTPKDLSIRELNIEPLGTTSTGGSPQE